MTGGGNATVTGHAVRQARRNLLARAGLALIVVLGLLTVVLANAHLVYVAFASQPGCVQHLKERGEAARPGSFRAAAPAC